jgi:hypothetical protein
MNNNQIQRVWAFALYSILYEAIIWGVFGWAVFVNGHSGWWVLVAVWASSSQLKPSAFGILPYDPTPRRGTSATNKDNLN